MNKPELIEKAITFNWDSEEVPYLAIARRGHIGFGMRFSHISRGVEYGPELDGTVHVVFEFRSDRIPSDMEAQDRKTGLSFLPTKLSVLEAWPRVFFLARVKEKDYAVGRVGVYLKADIDNDPLAFPNLLTPGLVSSIWHWCSEFLGPENLIQPREILEAWFLAELQEAFTGAQNLINESRSIRKSLAGNIGVFGADNSLGHAYVMAHPNFPSIMDSLESVPDDPDDSDLPA